MAEHPLVWFNAGDLSVPGRYRFPPAASSLDDRRSSVGWGHQTKIQHLRNWPIYVPATDVSGASTAETYLAASSSDTLDEPPVDTLAEIA